MACIGFAVAAGSEAVCPIGTSVVRAGVLFRARRNQRGADGPPCFRNTGLRRHRLTRSAVANHCAMSFRVPRAFDEKMQAQDLLLHLPFQAPRLARRKLKLR